MSIPLAGIDIAILVFYILLVFGIGLFLSRRASRSTEEFFVSGRSLPWWIIGTSMVATTFAADTPLVVSGLVAQGGIYKNWLWWQ
ncbi:MAG: sodium:proline symporter, partial [Candidatus Krumholzibacteria bacterium]|nr:sodium:proline symporter [Candidatus Krumholzibacteria bacterium]